jgi:hypothetical protein
VFVLLILSKYRVLVTPAKRGKGTTAKALDEQTPAEKRASMTWAKRLKRVVDQACQRKLFHMENPNWQFNYFSCSWFLYGIEFLDSSNANVYHLQTQMINIHAIRECFDDVQCTWLHGWAITVQSSVDFYSSKRVHAQGYIYENSESV